MTSEQTLLHLSRTDLEALAITTRDGIAAIERGFQAQAAGKVWVAPKAVLQPGDGRYMMAALAAGDEPPYLVVKALVLNPDNADKELPQINGTMLLLHSDTGLPAASMDGNWITEVRTAALSATAAVRMARPESSVAAFIGCGAQARSHLKAFHDLFPLREIRALGRGQANIDRLCREAKALGLEAKAPEDPRAAIEGADLIVSSITLTAEVEPYIDAGWLKPGAFASITDVAKPWKTHTMTAFDRVIIDDREQEAAMEQKQADPAQVAGDLAELVLGKAKGRAAPEERTAFIFRAHPMGDFALSALAMQRASQ